jgi:hypothetical protein
MRESEGFVIDVGALLEKVEEAAPIDAVEVVPPSSAAWSTPTP